MRTLICAAASLMAVQATVPPRVEAQQPTAEQMARAMELTAPGPEHRTLISLAGEWDQTARIWPAPGAEPVEFTGRAVSRTILGDRFLEITSRYSMAGTAVESVTIMGFDRRREEYTVVGMDTEGTYWVTARGTRDGSGAILMRGTDDDPVLGHKQVYDFRVTIDGPDRYVVEVIFHDEAHTRGGGPFRMVEVVHTRRSS